MHIIKITNLIKAFGYTVVLKKINLEIEKGTFLTIFGPNGAGKSTLIKIMAALVSPTAGTVSIDGFDVRESPNEVRKRIGVISHETYLYRELTAYENLQFFGKMYDVEDIDSRIKEVLAQVGLQFRKDDRVGTFSRGMKQRLSIARAILHDPPILLLDEPYTGLDQHASSTFDKLLLGLDAGDKTRIMISHDLERGIALCDRAIILVGGEIVHELAGDEIRDLKQCRAIYEKHVGAAI